MGKEWPTSKREGFIKLQTGKTLNKEQKKGVNFFKTMFDEVTMGKNDCLKKMFGGGSKKGVCGSNGS